MIQRIPSAVIIRNLFLFIFSLTMVSCVTNRKTQYLQEIDDVIPHYNQTTQKQYIIQPGDELFINISPFDPEVKKNFSIEQAQVSYSQAEAMLNLQSYQVYKDGNIDFPMLGKIKMAGLSTREAREKMEKVLASTIFRDANVTVKLVNNYVSIVGDVKKPGKYVIYKENLNIFQTLAMAGDISTFGNRANVRVIRHNPEEIEVKEFDLRSEEIINSEFYYVQPNDVIYVSRLKGQFFGMDSFTDFVSLISGSLSIFVVSLSLWNK